ncbi:MAG: hypothetical protein ACREL7_15125 [Longimicrobiales bacterium]
MKLFLCIGLLMLAVACGGDEGGIGAGPGEWRLTGPDVTIGVIEG